MEETLKQAHARTVEEKHRLQYRVNELMSAIRPFAVARHMAKEAGHDWYEALDRVGKSDFEKAHEAYFNVSVLEIGG